LSIYISIALNPDLCHVLMGSCSQITFANSLVLMHLHSIFITDMIAEALNHLTPLHHKQWITTLTNTRQFQQLKATAAWYVDINQNCMKFCTTNLCYNIFSITIPHKTVKQK
jgi:hypothetical protein